MEIGRDHVEGRVLERRPATGMMPFDGMSSSAGAGKPAAIEPARWNPLAAEPVVVLLHRVVERIPVVRERNRAGAVSGAQHGQLSLRRQDTPVRGLKFVKFFFTFSALS